MSYQAVVHNATGQLIVNQSVSLRASILQGSANGPSVFSETHNPTTNSQGLFSVELGGGVPILGMLSAVNWAAGPYFLKTEVDPNGGVDYSVVGVTQLLSVPYALFSGNGVPSGGGPGQVLTMCNGVPTWTTGGQCPTATIELACSGVTLSGSLVQGVAAGGVSFSVPYTNGNGTAYSGVSMASSGVGGVTAVLAPGTLASGSGVLQIQVTGTPTSSGMAVFALSMGNQMCTLSIPVGVNGNPGGGSSSCSNEAVLNPNAAYGSLTDQDGNTYKTVVIGGQEWMAENLRASHFRNGELIPIVTNNSTWGSLTSAGTCWYNNDSATYHCPFGKMYNWFSAVDARNVCPVGWHVPSDSEWNALIGFLDSTFLPFANGDQSMTAGARLKTTGTQYWASPNLGALNSSGFSALPSGYRFNDVGNFINMGVSGGFWSTTPVLELYAWCRGLNVNLDATRRTYGYKQGGFSIRCVRD